MGKMENWRTKQRERTCPCLFWEGWWESWQLVFRLNVFKCRKFNQIREACSNERVKFNEERMIYHV